MRFLPEPTLGHDRPGYIGIVLINLGTPDTPTPAAVRTYLKEFLSDPRVVELPRWLWWPILHGYILNTRPKHSAIKYASIWDKEGSPLRLWSEKQAKLVRGLLGERGVNPCKIGFAMRYGNPSIPKVMNELKAAGCDRLLIVPLYPQYAASSTGSAIDAVGQVLAQWRWQPSLRVMPAFATHPRYIEALAKHIQQYWFNNGRGDHLLLSFHGLPAQSSAKGDPYEAHCQHTTSLLAQALNLNKEQISFSFQSRFGPKEWLKPYTSDMLQRLGKRKINRLDVFCPGFVADCLETLEEIAIEGKGIFLAAGGQEFCRIPCFNDQPEWISALCDLIGDEISGWLTIQKADTPK